MRASWLTSEASVFTTRPAKLPIEAVPTAFAKDGIIDDENAVRVDWTTPPIRASTLARPCLGPPHASATMAGVNQRGSGLAIYARSFLVFDQVYTLAARAAGSWRAPPLRSCCASAAAKAKVQAGQAGARPRGGAARGAARGAAGLPPAKIEKHRC